METDHKEQVVLGRSISNIPFAFVPSTCEILQLDETSVPLINARVAGYEAPTVCCKSQVEEVNDYYKVPSSSCPNSLSGRTHPSGLAIIVTQSCNLSCSYCLAKQGNFGLDVSQASFSDIRSRIKSLYESGFKPDFVKFFGGEPTLEINLIRDICSFIRYELKEEPIFAVTTNGTTNAEKHIEIWKEFNVSVSVSIDGPEFIHDSTRVKSNGKGSYKSAISYCETLKRNNFPFAVLSVFDERHLENNFSYLDTIRFLNEISPLSKVQFVEEIGDSVGLISDDLINKCRDQIIEAVDAIFKNIQLDWVTPLSKQWLYDNNIFRFISGIVCKSATPYTSTCTASSLISLFPSGDSYSCYTLTENDDYLLGCKDTDSENILRKQSSISDAISWTNFKFAPWYRGVVGDVCLSDMKDSEQGMRSSIFYSLFQEVAVYRVLQNLVDIHTDSRAIAKLTHSIHEHQKITGQFINTRERSSLKDTHLNEFIGLLT
ncbi:TPA: radical SAM protein [Vibrio parahaemolyticus]